MARVNTEIRDEPESLTSALLQRLREAIHAAGGWLPFDRFMAMALYEPGLGYYANSSPKFGQLPGGTAGQGSDFVTAPELSPLFGATLARQVAQALPAGIVGFCISGTFLTQGFPWPFYIQLALVVATSQFANEALRNATATARAATRRPSSRRMRNGSSSQSRPAAGRDTASRAPNFCACAQARPASACPEMPVGKPR